MKGAYLELLILLSLCLLTYPHVCVKLTESITQHNSLGQGGTIVVAQGDHVCGSACGIYANSDTACSYLPPPFWEDSAV